MPKKALSVTLAHENLLWLQGQTVASKRKSLSDTIDGLITQARQSGQVAPLTVRSVVGTIDIDPHDPDLLTADADIRALFDRSLRRPFVVREKLQHRSARRLKKPRA